ncbi:uncharacterized protein MEPE_01148 [Melanopsichium pennsylvanicum]|uniref:Uncharacterized protein n=1 Tax=Melanopsichium pennsylvanicum TaxID=63383 RepID=A0AAJ5C3C4_9BASI|nr:uncharacterized protein MEPE_01148 [Melanopsichium pennsylvanicum]
MLLTLGGWHPGLEPFSFSLRVVTSKIVTPLQTWNSTSAPNTFVPRALILTCALPTYMITTTVQIHKKYDDYQGVCSRSSLSERDSLQAGAWHPLSSSEIALSSLPRSTGAESSGKSACETRLTTLGDTLVPLTESLA